MSTYEHNMQLLAERYPELVTRLQRGVDTRHITVKTAHSGVPRLLVTSRKGTRVYIHNEDDPIATARHTASKLQLGQESLIVLLGFGLGYLALEILTRMHKGHFLLICETDLGIFETALRYTALEPLLRSEQVRFLVGEDIPLAEWLRVFQVKYFLSKVSLITYHPSFQITPERYKHLEKQVRDTTRMLSTNANTLVAFGQLTMQNLFANMPWICQLPGVQRLANRFVGRPGIVVASGPSLDKNVSLLKDVKGKAVIIAIDTVQGLLLPHGILPDIVLTLDPQQENYAKFRDLALEASVPLTFHPLVCPEIVKYYPGKKFVAATGFPLYQRFASYSEGKAMLDQHSNSVAHMAFNLACLLGVDPIILVGLDLSFSQIKAHAGNLLEEVVTAEEYASSAVWTTNIFGEPVTTNASFQTSQQLFEQGIQSAGVRCIDATEGGVRLAGTQVMRLREAIDTYCQGEPIDIAGIINATASEPVAFDRTGLLDELQELDDEVRGLMKTCGKIVRSVRLLKRMQGAGKTTQPRYTRLAMLLEQATSSLHEHEDLLNLLPYHAYQLELYMSQQHIVEIDAIADQEERFEKQLERALVYYPALQEILGPLAQALNALIKHLRAEQKLDQALTDAAPDALLSLALQYEDLRRYDRAIPLFEQCLQGEPEQPEALYHLAAIYLQQGRYRDALSLLESGRQVHPEFRGIHKLYAACRQKLASWEARLHQVRQRRHTAEENNLLSALLGAGNFYFRVGDLERARAEYSKVLETHPDLPEAHYHLAHTYLAAEDFTAGLAELETTLKLAPDNPVVYRDLGLVACHYNKYEAAARFLHQAIELKPGDADLLSLLGDIYVQSGDWQRAAQTYEALLQLDPERPGVLQTLAALYQQQIAAAVR